MIVVADSAPLHYLILLEQTELLPRLYGQVVIPDAVLQELSAAKAPQPVKNWLSQPPSWLSRHSVTPSQLQAVTADLDLGEREAIALAHFLRADLLLIDELSGRVEARRLNLRLTGTLGILRTAAAGVRGSQGGPASPRPGGTPCSGGRQACALLSRRRGEARRATGAQPIEPATCRVVTFRRFQRLMVAMARVRAARAFSS